MITFVLLGVLLLPFVVIGGILALFWKKMRRAILRWSLVLYVILAVSFLLGIAPYLGAWSITHAGTRQPDRLLKDTPAEYQVQYKDVVFQARDGLNLSGWFITLTGDINPPCSGRHVQIHIVFEHHFRYKIPFYGPPGPQGT